jgi:hypothetical protein
MYECWLPEVYFSAFDLTTASKPRSQVGDTNRPGDSSIVDAFFY